MRDDLLDEIGSLEDLGRPEHLLVWALRAIAIGHGDCPLVSRTFAKACGPLGGQALAAYFALVRYIGMTGRRRLQVHLPGCPCVSVDETAVVGVIAAAQHPGCGSGETLLGMRMRFLVGGEPHEAFLSAARAVAGVLAASGHIPPLRLEGDARKAVEAGTAQLRVVH